MASMRDLARLPPSISATRTVVPAGNSVKGFCIKGSLKDVVEVDNKFQNRECQWGKVDRLVARCYIYGGLSGSFRVRLAPCAAVAE
jgi:hypothetical protein